MKVRFGRVVEMSKTMDPAEADGENLGIVKFGAEGAAVLVAIMDQLIGAGGTRDWAPRAFGEFAQTRPLHAIGTRGLPWIEIDFPADYQRAIREVLPQIEADGVLPGQRPVRRGWDGLSERRLMRADRRSGAARQGTARLLADAS